MTELRDQPHLARALRRRYPCVRVFARVYLQDFETQELVFEAPNAVLEKHGLIPQGGKLGTVHDEFGALMHITRRHNGNTQVQRFEWSEAPENSSHSNPDNKKTRAAVVAILTRISKGIARS